MNIQPWAVSELSRLGYPNPKQTVACLLELEEKSAVEEFLCAMLDIKNSDHKHFMKEFLQKFSENKSSLGPGFYKKPDIEEFNDSSKTKNKDKEKTTPPGNQKLNNSLESSSSKKKTKFVSIFSDEGASKDVILLPGRHKCNCQASKHKLVNNCLNCGRIVCEQEGSGPCAFCQTLVMSKEEKEIIDRGNKKSEALHNKLIHNKKIISNDDDDQGINKKLQEAIEHKNKLLEYDKTSEKRTKVYDDESDYFQTNSRWVKPADREKLQKYEEEMMNKKYDKTNTKYKIDLLGRKVLNNGENYVCDPEDPILKEILDKPNIYSYEGNEESFKMLNISHPVYVGESDSDLENRTIKSDLLPNGLHRLQDRELKEMRDDGMCLSMHQPWASLLVAGIKKHEGRVWYSSHRGRLWIASTAKTPTPSEISQLEQTYRILLKNENIKFPQHYPAGCLLGCVDVIDVLPQEEYRRWYPEGESESPYVFICENPQGMIIKFPMKGKYKIYKLDPKIHQAALKSIKMA